SAQMLTTPTADNTATAASSGQLVAMASCCQRRRMRDQGSGEGSGKGSGFRVQGSGKTRESLLCRSRGVPPRSGRHGPALWNLCDRVLVPVFGLFLNPEP